MQRRVPDGYKLRGDSTQSLLYKSSQNTLIRVTNEKYGDCILKMHTKEIVQQQEIDLLEKEYNIQFLLQNNMQIDENFKIYEMLEHNGFHILVLEDFGAKSLDSLISEKPLNLEEFFEICGLIAKRLAQIHSSRIIHFDIKPSNILYSKEKNILKIIDFATSAITTVQSPSVPDSNISGGSPAYMSPEQTKRLSTHADRRSDIYSLGISFYHLLTTKLPFKDIGFEALSSAHLSKRAPHMNDEIPSNFPKIPKAIISLVNKMIEKNPSDRYQSVRTVYEDISKLEQIYKSTGNLPEDFVPGENDIVDEFSIPTLKLYGRSNEIESLSNSISRSLSGKKIFCTVKGYSGIGKTALIEKVINQFKGKVILGSGKFDLVNKSIPYSAFVQSIKKIASLMYGIPSKQLKETKNRLMEKLDGNGGLLLSLIPELQGLLPDVNPSEKSILQGQELQNAFQNAICSFLSIASIVCGEFNDETESKVGEAMLVVLFIDDLQWADYNSMLLVEKIVTTPSLPVLIIGAYRDNEVGVDHPLNEVFATLNKNNIELSELKLNELSETDLNELVSDSTFKSIEETMSLTEIIFKKTKGNPFFSRQFLSNLYQKGILTFDSSTKSWAWDLSIISNLSFSDNVIDFMLTNIGDTATEVSKSILSCAACIGSVFDILTLSDLYGKSKNETQNSLTQSIQEGWIFEIAPNQFKFAHDRVQEACYKLPKEEERCALHKKLALLIYSSSIQNNKPIEDRIFEIVNHLNKSIELIRNDPETRKLFFELNHQAAVKALDSSASSLSVQYCETSIQLFNEDSWNTEYETRFNFAYIYIQALTSNKQLKEGLEVGEDVLENIKKVEHSTPLHELKLKSLLIRLYTGLTRYEDGYNTLQTVLSTYSSNYVEFELKDENIVLQKIQESFGITIQLLTESFNHPDEEKLIENEELYYYLECMSSGSATFYLVDTGSPYYFIQYAVLIARTILENGYTPGSAIILGAFSIANYVLTSNADLSNKITKHIKHISMKHWPSDWMFCNANFHDSLWVGAENKTIVDSIKSKISTYRSGLSTGNNTWASYSSVLAQMQMVLCGYKFSEAYDFIIRTFTYSAKIGNILTMLLGEDCKNVMLILKGERDTFTDPEEYVIKPSMGINPRTLKFIRCTSPFYEAFSYQYMGRNIEAYNAIKKSGSHLQDVIPFYPYLVYHFTLSTIIAEILFKGQQKEIGKTFEELVQEIDQCILAQEKHCEQMPRFFKSLISIMKGDRERLNGPDADIMKIINYYQTAISKAIDDQMPNIQAMASLRLADYLSHKGFFSDSFASYILNSIEIYKVLGYDYIVSRLSEKYADVINSVNISITKSSIETLRTFTMAETKTITSLSSGEGNNNSLVAATTLAQSYDSSDVDLKVLFRSILPIIMSNAAATKSILILKGKESNDMFIEAISNSCDEQVNLIDSEPMNDKLLSIAAVNRALRTRTETIIPTISNDDAYSMDPYFTQNNNIKSAMVTPIIYQNKVRGAIYLENEEMDKVFTQERSRLLTVIISVSMHNAEFYAKLTNSYARFLPRPFLKLLGRNNVLDVKQGDSVTNYSCVSFLDIRNFTGITENLTAESAMMMVNQFLEYVCPEIENNQGFIDKFIGDAVMSLYPHSPVDALKASTRMIHALERLNREHYVQKKPLRMGIGLHYGKIQLGTVGYASRLDATCIGDTVNMASRVESLSKTFGTNIIASEEYYNRLMKENTDLETIRFINLGSFILSGKTEPTSLYEIYDTTWKDDESPRNEVPKILEFIAERKFKECEEFCIQTSKNYKNNAVLKLYAEICSIYKNYDLPSSWNGEIPLSKDGTPKTVNYPLLKTKDLIPSTNTNTETNENLNSNEEIQSMYKELKRYKAIFGRLSKKNISNYCIKWNEEKKRYEKVLKE